MIDVSTFETGKKSEQTVRKIQKSGQEAVMMNRSGSAVKIVIYANNI